MVCAPILQGGGVSAPLGHPIVPNPFCATTCPPPLPDEPTDPCPPFPAKSNVHPVKSAFPLIFMWSTQFVGVISSVRAPPDAALHDE